jgi:hypothetical protein
LYIVVHHFKTFPIVKKFSTPPSKCYVLLFVFSRNTLLLQNSQHYCRSIAYSCSSFQEIPYSYKIFNTTIEVLYIVVHLLKKFPISKFSSPTLFILSRKSLLLQNSHHHYRSVVYSCSSFQEISCCYKILIVTVEVLYVVVHLFKKFPVAKTFQHHHRSVLYSCSSFQEIPCCYKILIIAIEVLRHVILSWTTSQLPDPVS